MYTDCNNRVMQITKTAKHTENTCTFALTTHYNCYVSLLMLVTTLIRPLLLTKKTTNLYLSHWSHFLQEQR